MGFLVISSLPQQLWCPLRIGPAFPVPCTGGIASYLGLLSWVFSEPMVDGVGFHMRFLVMAEKRLIDSNEISVTHEIISSILPGEEYKYAICMY